MKKIVVVLLTLLILISEGAQAVDYPNNEDTGFEYKSCCGEDGVIEKRHQALLQKRALEMQQKISLNSVQPATVIPTYAGSTLMPSTGSVKMLVLPISFPDYPQYKNSFDIVEWENRFFSPYNPELKPWEQSVRGYYYRESYGKLDITGTVLPVYEAPLKSSAYASSEDMLAQLTADALTYYCERGLDISGFDNDSDGCVDALIVHQLRRGFSSEEPQGIIKSLSGKQVGNYNVDDYALISITHLSASEDQLYEHEIGHLLGLLDNYRNGDNKFDVNLFELMFGIGYINVYYKYLLGWIEPIIVTGEDQIDVVELSPVELLPDGENTPPKALVLIPNTAAFPFTEYYIAEYRTGGMKKPLHAAAELIYDISPGIVIWHCNTILNSFQQYKYSTDYLKPIYKNGTDRYTEKDIYVTGDEFSASSVPGSNFYNGVYTGAYLYVDELTSDKAILQAGFQNPDLSPKPIIEISPPSKRVIKKGEKSEITVTVKAGKELLTLDDAQVLSLFSFSTSGETTSAGAGHSSNKNPMTIQIFASWYSPPYQGDGTIWVDIPAGAIRYNGKDSAAVTSQKIYVDNTPPTITLNGDNPQRLQQGAAYTELGAVVSDNLDPDIEVKLQTDSSNVDTNTLGTYTVTYSVTDHAGHTATAERTVIVEEKVPTHTHTYSEVWSKNEAGHWHECSACHDKSDMSPHTEDGGTVTKQPTQEETGVRTYSCSVCGYEMRTEIIDKLETSHTHSYSQAWYMDETMHWHECECGDKADEAIHIPVTDPAVKATCTTSGKTEGSHCSECGYVLQVQVEIPAVGHKIPEQWHYDGDYGNVSHWHICDGCKEIFDLEEHSEDGGVETKAPTAATPGVKTFTCMVCGWTRTETIPATGGPVDPGPGPDQPVTPPIQEPEPTETPQPQVPVETEPPAAEKKELPFTDVKVNSWYYAAVDQMYQEGLMGGTTATTFSPSTPASRAMLVTILYRMEGEPTVTNPTSFPDVKAKWCAPAIAWAAEHGIVLGYADGTFGPNDEVTREQVAAILFRYAQYKGWDTTAQGDLSPYSDSGKIHKYARESVAWAVGMGLISGRSQDWLAPRENTTRAELAVVMTRLIGAKKMVGKE